MPNDAVALVAAFEAKLDKFQKDMDSAYGMADKGVRKIEDRFAKTNVGLPPQLMDIAKGGLGPFAALLSGMAVFDKLKEGIATLAALGNESKRVGQSAEDFQTVQYALVATGASAETAGAFMQRFTRASSEAAHGQGELSKLLRANNIDLEAYGKLTPTEQLIKFAQLVRNAKTEQDQMNLAFMAGGRGAGPEMVRALLLIGDNFDRVKQQAKDAGVVIDQELIDRAEKIQQAWDLKKLQAGVFFGELGIWFSEQLKISKDQNKLWADAAGKDVKGVADEFVALGATIRDAFKGAVGDGADVLELLRRMLDILPKLSLQGVHEAVYGPSTPLPGIDVNGNGDVPLPRPRPAGNGSTVMPDPRDEEFRKLIEAQHRRIETLDAEAATVGRTAAEQARLRTEIDLESKARQQNIPLTAARRDQIEAEANAMAAATQRLEDYKNRWQAINDVVKFAGEQAIEVLDGIGDKYKKLSDVIAALAPIIRRNLLSALLLGEGPLAGILGTKTSIAGGTGGIGGLLLSLFGVSPGGQVTGQEWAAAGQGLGPLAARASGGPVMPGNAYWVGEQGPEPFIPSVPGTIIPNHALGGGDTNISITVDVTGANGDAAIARIAKAGIMQGLKAYDRQAQQQLPARLAQMESLG